MPVMPSGHVRLALEGHDRDRDRRAGAADDLDGELRARRRGGEERERDETRGGSGRCGANGALGDGRSLECCGVRRSRRRPAETLFTAFPAIITNGARRRGLPAGAPPLFSHPRPVRLQILPSVDAGRPCDRRIASAARSWWQPERVAEPVRRRAAPPRASDTGPRTRGTARPPAGPSLRPRAARVGSRGARRKFCAFA